MMKKIGCCQFNANLSPIGRETAGSRDKLTPLSQRGGTVLLESLAAVELTIEVEVVVDRGMDGSKFLQGFHVPEFRHRALSSPEWLM